MTKQQQQSNVVALKSIRLLLFWGSMMVIVNCIMRKLRGDMMTVHAFQQSNRRHARFAAPWTSITFTRNSPGWFAAATPRHETPSFALISSSLSLSSSSTRRNYHTGGGNEKGDDDKEYVEESWDETAKLSSLATSIQQAVHAVASTQQRFITLSVSGGCDSVALLHACMEWLLTLPRDSDDNTFVQVVHFNHQQRDKESDADAALVQELCQRYQIPCRIELWQDYGETSFSQDVARTWRRQRLLELTQQAISSSLSSSSSAVGIILTAHHKDDSIESLLLKALRGVHLLNLSGMKHVTPISTTQSIYLVRPWVNNNVSKQHLLDYLIDRGLSWREDESNASPKYLRNRVRNELIPLLQELSGGTFVDSRIPAWMQQSQELADDLQPRVQTHLAAVLVEEPVSNTNTPPLLFDWERSCALLDETAAANLLCQTPLVQSQALYQWISKQSPGVLLSQESLGRLIHQLRFFPDRTEWILELSQGCQVQRIGAVLRLATSEVEIGGNNKAFNQRQWNWSIVRDDTGRSTKNETMMRDRWSSSAKHISIWLSSGLLEGDWRNELIFYQTSVNDYEEAKRANGDRASLHFVPPWRNSAVKLRQFLRGQGVPVHRRGDVDILIARSQTTTGENEFLVAVQVAKKGDGQLEWILHRNVCEIAWNAMGSDEPVNSSVTEQERYHLLLLAPPPDVCEMHSL